MIYSKIFRAARANLLRVVKNFWRKTHEKSKIYLKIFPRCARQFVKNFIKVNFFKRIMNQFCQDLRKTRNTLFAAFFPGPRSPDYLQHRFKFNQRNEPCKLSIYLFYIENISNNEETDKLSSASHFLNLYHTQVTCRQMLTEGLLATLHSKHIFWDSWAKLVVM